uniref:Uncharacterized protein n=1 Tax=Eutreptiella gymnastica TaxID=73025 RepID=A0A7S1J9K9_9EUGL|mmetsp:Transcript_78149/g.137954  ORF Transcript_78149/g.137954 Transcript_78149/m.137954 type:complete len:116 (+) Transcript_78149:112-459(+)
MGQGSAQVKCVPQSQKRPAPKSITGKSFQTLSKSFSSFQQCSSSAVCLFLPKFSVSHPSSRGAGGGPQKDFTKKGGCAYLFGTTSSSPPPKADSVWGLGLGKPPRPHLPYFGGGE